MAALILAFALIALAWRRRRRRIREIAWREFWARKREECSSSHKNRWASRNSRTGLETPLIERPTQVSRQ